METTIPNPAAETEASRRQAEYNVLYVDDETSNLRIFRMAFKRHYNIYIAENGAEAIEILRNNQIHLIITDQKMPEMTGTELLEKTLDEFPNLVRIILTGFADIESIVRAVNRCGIYKYITKPYDQGEMKLTLDKALESFKLKGEKDILLEKLAQSNAQLEDKVRERTSELEEANKRLTSGLTYAKSIQDTLLPAEEEIAKDFSGVFIVHKPKDIVGGDFYWFHKTSDSLRSVTVLALADCMGHGVAGALLSMIGESQLSYIVKDKKVYHSDSILEMLDEGVTGTLSRQGVAGSETMDVAVVVIDRQKKVLEYSGAKLDIVFVSGGKVNRVKSSIKPIGFVSTGKSGYQREMLDLTGISHLYLFSDGLQDQMDHTTGKRFGSKQVIELIESIHPLDLASQKQAVLKTIGQLTGNAEQTDDITFLGVEL